MKVVRMLLRIIAYLMLFAALVFVVLFALSNMNIIDNPFENKAAIVNISQSEIRLKKGNGFQLNAKVYPENSRNSQVVYESDKEEVATVNEVTGYVEAKRNGVATITASLKNNHSIKSECIVVVSGDDIEIKGITLSTKKIDLIVGKKYVLNYKLKPKEATLHDIEYLTSDPSVATVDNKGEIEAKGAGSCNIIVRDKITGIQAEAVVNVHKKTSTTVEPKEIKLSPSVVTINVGGSKQIKAEIKPNEASKSVTWESLDTNIATISNKGVVTGKSEGVTKIVGTTINGLEGYVEVNVTTQVIKVEGIKVDNSSITMDLGTSKTVEYTITPSNATNQGVKITSSDSDIVKIQGDKMLAMNSGKAVVTITTKDGGYKDTINVTVNKVDNIIEESDITLTKTSVSLEVGGTVTVEAKIVPNNATYKSVEWESANSSIATVDNGLIKGIKKGTTEIIVKSLYKKITKKIKVEVKEVTVESISLDKKSASITEGETISLVKTISPSNATNKEVTWTSSNTSVATVSNNGVVKGIKSGTATITVKTSNGKVATCTITVKENSIPATSVSLDKQEINTTVGDKIYLTATISPSNATNKTLTWTSSNEKVAKVSDGVVETKGVGEATITVKTSNGKTGTCKVKVSETTVDVESISLNKTNTTINVGSSETLKVTFNPTNATNKKITWTSKDSSIAKVDSNGKVSGVKVGTTIITAKTSNGKSATCTVIVNQVTTTVSVTSVSLNKTSTSINVGSSETLVATVSPSNATNKSVSWKSSDTSIATVDSNGKVSGVKAGSANITVTTADGSKTATCKVVVNQVTTTVSVTGVSLNKTSTKINVGNTETLVATVTPSNATNKSVIWTSSDTSIATVDSSGQVKGIKAGTATITAKTSDGSKTATCKVNVVEPTTTIAVTGVSLNKTSTTINVGKTETLTATLSPDNATNKSVTWTSSNEGVATVSSKGKVTAVSAGEATITVTTKDGSKTATCKVNVVEPITTIAVTSVSLNKTSTSIVAGKSETLVVTVSPDNASDKTITWSSSDTSIATVNNGKVVAVSEGKATITAQASNGKKATCKVKVTAAPYDIFADREISKRMKEVFGNVSEVTKCSSDTLKYRILKSHDNYYNYDQYIALVWVADQTRQLNSALASYGSGYTLSPSDSILSNEKRTFFEGKDGCMIAVNGSFFTQKSGSLTEGGYHPIVISKGKIVYDGTDGKTSYKRLSITSDGILKVLEYKTPQEFLNAGVLNTWDMSHGRKVKNVGDEYYYKGSEWVHIAKPCSTGYRYCDKRTLIGQATNKADRNNFVLISGYGPHDILMGYAYRVTGGKVNTYYNLDGSGSRRLYYRNSESNGNKLLNSGDGRYIADMLYFSEHAPKGR